MDIILERRSVRKFDSTKKISKEDLIDLCKYGESAPSAKNQKSRAYVIIDDVDMLKKLSTISPYTRLLDNAAAAIAVIGTDPSVLSVPQMQVQDLSAATENILLAATSKNIGSCWLGLYPHEDRVLFSGDYLNVDAPNFVFAIIALGYPEKEDSFFDANKIKDEMIHYNRW